MGAISQTTTCMYTIHTPRTQAPGGLRVYTRQHTHTLRGACVNTNAQVRRHARRGAAHQARRPADPHMRGGSVPGPQGSPAPTPQLRWMGRAALIHLCPGLGCPLSSPPPDCPSRPRSCPALAVAQTKVGAPTSPAPRYLGAGIRVPSGGRPPLPLSPRGRRFRGPRRRGCAAGPDPHAACTRWNPAPGARPLDTQSSARAWPRPGQDGARTRTCPHCTRSVARAATRERPPPPLPGRPHTSNCQWAACSSCFAWSAAQPAVSTNWLIMTWCLSSSMFTDMAPPPPLPPLCPHRPPAAARSSASRVHH